MRVYAGVPQAGALAPDPVPVGVHDLPRRLVSSQRDELGEERAREHDRVSLADSVRGEHDPIPRAAPFVDHDVDDHPVDAGLITEQHRHRLCSHVQCSDPRSI